MKIITLLATAALSLACVSAASAQTTIRITGSSAYRGSVHNAIVKLMGATGSSPSWVLPNDSYSGYGWKPNSSGSTDISNANVAVFRGYINSNQVIIKVTWSGSAAGIQTVSENLNVSVIADSALSALTRTGADLGSGVAMASEIPDVAMSDTFQSTSPFNSVILTRALDSAVGVVPFKWIVSYNTPAAVTNITAQQVQAIFGTGEVPLSVMTGDTGLSGTMYALGRDPDSGTRLTAFAESGLGATATVFQWEPVFSGSSVASQDYWHPITVNGIPVVQGNGGYSSGSGVADALRYNTSGIGGYYVGYLSTGDATRAISTGTAGAGNAREITYNGVLYSVDNVRRGFYTFWGYEHMYYRSSLAGVSKTTADAIATQVKNVDATILLSTMLVERQTDGGTVTPK